MRIRTDGDRAYRGDVIQEAADFWGLNKTDAVVASCDLAGRVLPQLQEAIADADIRPSEKKKLVEAIETRNVSADYDRGDVSLEADG